MLEWSDVHIFSHQWKLMVEAAYRKYPNPYSSHVHSLDTFDRRISGSTIYSNRLFCTLWKIPTIVLKVVGTNPQMYVKEQSICDLDHKILIIQAQNISLSNFFTLNETLEYSICKDDPSKTILKQTACINVHGIPLLGDLMEKLWLSQYKSSIANGRMGIESIAVQIIQEKQCF